MPFIKPQTPDAADPNDDATAELDQATAATAPRARVRRPIRTGPEARRRRRRVWTYGVVAASTVLMINALIGEKGLLANMQARRELQQVSQSLDQLKDENARLIDQIHRLRSDPDALEFEARDLLGLVKPGETLFTIHDRPPGRK